MRFITGAVAALILIMAGSAMAREKTVDVTDASAADVVTSTFNAPLSGTLSNQSGTYDRIYNEGAINTNCGVEAIDSANDGMYYDVFCFQVDDGNPIELVVDAAGTDIFDTVLTLYCSEFDPSQPELNVIGFDDDNGEGTLSAFTAAQDIRLEPGNGYWLVVSTYGASMTGNYVIQRSSNVFDCGIVTDEAVNWGSVKGLYR